MPIQGGEIISHLILDTSQYFNSFERAMAAARGAGGAMQTFGRAASMGITMPIAGAAAASSKAAIDFESAFAGVKKTIDATDKEYAKLREGILKMSGEIPSAAGELARIMELGGQLNVPMENLNLFTETIAGLAVSTNLSADAASTMLAQYMNIMRMDFGNIDRLGSVIVELGNNTATTESEIVLMAQRLAGAGRIAGLTEYEVLALSATMASLGINAEAGASSMGLILQNISKYIAESDEEIKVLAKTAGMNEESFTNMFGEDPLAALQAFLSGLNEIDKAGGNIYEVLGQLKFNNIRVLQTITGMLGGEGQLTENAERAKKAWEENTALAEETGKRYETTESQIQIAKNKIEQAAISIGDAILPTINEIAEKVGAAADSFTQLNDEQRGTIISIGGIAALAGPAIWAVGRITTALTGPNGLIAAFGLTGAALALLAENHKDNVFERLNKSMGNIKLSAEQIDKIVKQGFGEPAIDFSALDKARGQADGTLESLNELQNKLANDTYMISLGLLSPTEADIQAQCGGIVNTANEYLALSENAAKMTVSAYFGSDTAGGDIISGIDEAMGPLKDQLALKGKELGDALKGAIADGKIDAEERQIIANLQKEITEITTQGALLKSQAEKDVLIANAQYQGISAESVEKLIEGSEKYAGTLLKDYEQERDSVIRIVSNLKNLGAISESEYNARIADVFERYGNIEADVEIGKQDTLWAAFGKQISEFVNGKITRARELKQEGISLSLMYETPEDIAKQSELAQIKDEAGQMGAMLSPLIESFRTSYNELLKNGKEIPPYMEQIIKFFDELDNLSVMSDEWLKQEDYKAPDNDLINEGMTRRIEENKKRVENLTENVSDKAEENMNAAVNTIEGKQSEVKTAAEGVFEAIPESAEATKQPTESAVSGTMQSATNVTQSGTRSITGAVRSGLSPMPGAFRSIGSMAVSGLVSALYSGTGRVGAAASALAQTIESSVKSGLGIASPSKVMIGIGVNLIGTLAGTIAGNMPKIKKAAESIGDTFKKAESVYNAQSAGYADTYTDGRIERAKEENKEIKNETESREALIKRLENAVKSGTRIAGGGLPKPNKATRKLMDEQQKRSKSSGGGRSGGGSGAVLTKEIYDKSEFDYLRETVERLNDERERLLELSGLYRPYYDKTKREKEIEAVKEKYDKLIETEKESFENLSDEQKQAADKAHSDRLDDLNEMRDEEIEIINSNYELQAELAQGFLNSQKERLQAAFDAKKEQYRQDDYEKELKDLEKQARQTRSARKRRELNEKIDKMKRDEALRIEQKELEATLYGIDALYEAIGKGVIGLGDIIAAPNLPDSTYGQGLKHVQGLSAEQLDKALNAIEAGNKIQSGNTYTIDLKGAVIRDEQDIEKIADAFEKRMRSIERDYK